MPVSPPTVGLSFGSFGDIVSVLQLALDLRAALDESAGASAELRALVGDVDAFTRSLRDVQANIERQRRNLRPDVLNGIAAALSRCRGVLSAIQERISRARGQTSASGWHKYWGAAAWSILGGKKDVEALRARLSEQLGVIQLYLSLSEANSQECIQDVLVKQDATIQRIYTVVQDIQLRFDVGVPGFRFYNRETHRYEPPLARTSLQRLRHVCEALLPPDYPEVWSPWIEDISISEEDINNLSVISTEALIPINFHQHKWPAPGFVEAYFFREPAFGEWQVLLARTHGNSYLDRVLKILLERNRTIAADCNCPGGGGTRYQDEVNDLVWCSEATKAYAGVLSLIFDQLQPTGFQPAPIVSIINAFRHWPDPEHLRVTAPAILSRQHLSLEDMMDLVSKSPAYRKPAHPLIYSWDRHVFLFAAGGAALYESLVGYVLPFADESVSHGVRLPDWAYLSYSGSRDGVLAMYVNLNKCNCCRCME